MSTRDDVTFRTRLVVGPLIAEGREMSRPTCSTTRLAPVVLACAAYDTSPLVSLHPGVAHRAPPPAAGVGHGDDAPTVFDVAAQALTKFFDPRTSPNDGSVGADKPLLAVQTFLAQSEGDVFFATGNEGVVGRVPSAGAWRAFEQTTSGHWDGPLAVTASYVYWPAIGVNPAVSTSSSLLRAPRSGGDVAIANDCIADPAAVFVHGSFLDVVTEAPSSIVRVALPEGA